MLQKIKVLKVIKVNKVNKVIKVCKGIRWMKSDKSNQQSTCSNPLVSLAIFSPSTSAIFSPCHRPPCTPCWSPPWPWPPWPPLPRLPSPSATARVDGRPCWGCWSSPCWSCLFVCMFVVLGDNMKTYKPIDFWEKCFPSFVFLVTLKPIGCIFVEMSSPWKGGNENIT